MSFLNKMTTAIETAGNEATDASLPNDAGRCQPMPADASRCQLWYVSILTVYNTGCIIHVLHMYYAKFP